MPHYASETRVPVAKTQQEIEALLKRYGATAFVRGERDGKALLGFEMGDRQIRFILPMPNPHNQEIVYTPTGRMRGKAQQAAELEQASRQRWRALLLIIKAKLEAVEAGIVTLEAEFLPWTVTPSGQTVAEWLEPQMQRAIAGGEMPPMLPAFAR